MSNCTITTYSILATLCSLLTKEKERECVIKWNTASKNDIMKPLMKYQNFINLILNPSLNEYTLNMEESIYANQILNDLLYAEETPFDEIFLLAIITEENIPVYTDWQCKGVLHTIEPLNNNYQEAGIALYPYFQPYWNTTKSESARNHTLNTRFKNHFIIRQEDVSPFEIIMHYWNDEGLLQKTDTGCFLRTAITPVMDYAQLDTHTILSDNGSNIIVNGIKNKTETENKVLQIFESIFANNYSLIIFPETLGTDQLTIQIKKLMRRSPEYYTFVILPTVCHNGNNTLTVLGPGGVEILSQNKITPFIFHDKQNIYHNEKLEYSNIIHVLITKELGNIAFPICAEFLDPQYYSVLTSVTQINTIFCPSCSPGIHAFRTTMMKGLAGKILSIWVNTCSAKLFSAKEEISNTLSIVQLPDADYEKPLYEIKKECQGSCSAKRICYCDISICYKNEGFCIEKQWQCA